MTFERELDTAVTAARAAGRAILALAAGDGGVRVGRKEDWELVSEADLRAAEILHSAIVGAFPADGWLSEEHTDTSERLGRDRVWIVDPIDGTREFLSGVPEYAVSIALCVEGEPVLGVVHNPARDELHAASTPTSQPGPVDAVPAEPVVLVGRGEMRFREFPPLEAGTRVAAVGSVAYRLALLAAGTGDAVASGYGRKEWDVAAGIALTRAAGLRDSGILGDPIRFNQPDPVVRGLLVAPPSLHSQMLAFVRSRV